MKPVLVYVPRNALGMSITLVQELLTVAALYNGAAADEAVKLVSFDGKPVSTFSGTSLSVDYAIKDAPEAAAVFIGAFWGNAEPQLKTEAATISWLTGLVKKGTPVAATSNGPFYLAEAGLLDGKVATIYPPAAEQFSARYPSVTLRPERAITDAGDLYCANGIASGCDLAVALTEQLYGPDIARRIAKEFLLGFNRSYSGMNAKFDGQKYHQDKQILSAQQWLERHFAGDVNLEQVAADMGMSARNFSRRFKQATGESPSLYLKRVRMEAALVMLRDTTMPVAQIAYRTGYNDVGYFSRVFADYTGENPQAYLREIKQGG